MNNEDEVIEILDDFEENTITIKPITKDVIERSVSDKLEVSNNIQQPIQPSVNNNLGVSSPEEIKPKTESYMEVKNLNEVNYTPIEPEKQEIKMDVDTKDEESKSGLGFVIVLFILLAAFIIALPYISKLF